MDTCPGATPTLRAAMGGDDAAQNPSASQEDEETAAAIAEAKRRCSPLCWRLRQEVGYCPAWYLHDIRMRTVHVTTPSTTRPCALQL